MKTIAISGSLRKASFNTALLRAARDLAPADMAIEIVDIAAIPAYNADNHADGLPAPVQELIDSIRGADAVLIATPEYNYSIPGVLKNAIDWVSRAENQPFKGKAVGLMGVSPGVLGTARAQYHLRQVFVFLDALVMNRPEVFVGGARAKFDADGNLTDEGTREFLADYLATVKDWTEKVARMQA
jgi:chromate reductase